MKKMKNVLLMEIEKEMVTYRKAYNNLRDRRRRMLKQNWKMCFSTDSFARKMGEVDRKYQEIVAQKPVYNMLQKIRNDYLNGERTQPRDVLGRFTK